MSLHHFNLELPAAMTGYYEHSILVEIGSITQIEIYYPLNNNRYSKVWFSDGEQDIIPAEPNGYLTGNGNIQRFDLFEPVKTGKLKFRGSNSDPDFDHTIDAWVNIQPAGGVISGF